MQNGMEYPRYVRLHAKQLSQCDEAHTNVSIDHMYVNQQQQVSTQ